MKQPKEWIKGTRPTLDRPAATPTMLASAMPALKNAIERAKGIKGKPHMIVMKTKKSYGYIPGEGIKANHSMPIKKEDAEKAISALKEREGR